MAYFTLPEILEATNGVLVQPGAFAAFGGVTTDSRTCQAGEMFIPLKGEHFDGHRFIPGALQRGAWGLLVEERFIGRGGQGQTAPAPSPKPSPPTPYRGLGGEFEGRAGESISPGPPLNIPIEITVIAVPDTLTALGDLAHAWRRRFAIPVVALTGSCGKTTTKEMIAAVLSRAYRVLKNTMNLNNLIGMPQTLLELDSSHEAAVVEMGMNRFGEIHRLTRIAAPTVGLLLNAHPAHTEGVGDIEGVARAKAELVGALQPSATLVFNDDDPRLAPRAREFSGRTLGFGLGPTANLQARDRRSYGVQGQSATLSFRGQSWPLNLPVAGEHMLMNALAATAAGLCLGLAPEETAGALAGFKPVARRSQVETLTSGVNLLNDCYNANPGSMAVALKTLAELRDHGRLAAALGDMLELGDQSAAAHRDLGRLAAGIGLDILVIYGNFKEDVAAGAQEAGLPSSRVVPVATREEGAMVLKEFLQPGDWLLVKGSRSMHMEGLIELIKN
ncbi:MAG: UDP-N-acetylmuramoyl-tripeptide--D-alanyl-D-alanine ligase [Deltaproteobacteria bacterium]|nr:UDP-N-acetylmuramoyl-tripeptide--D-alanyl-D-alanine ligase [Deltaproteobacteria bacterium]